MADKGACAVVLEQVANGLALVEQKPLTLANAGPSFARILEGVTEFEFGGGLLFKAKIRCLALTGGKASSMLWSAESRLSFC